MAATPVMAARLQQLRQSAIDTARRGTAAAKSLQTQVEGAEGAGAHSSLQAANFSILDVYGGGNRLEVDLRRVEQTEQLLREQMRVSRRRGGWRGRLDTCCLRLRGRFLTFTASPKLWMFLLLLGFLSAGTAYLVDAPVDYLTSQRAGLVAGAGGGVVGYLVWLCWCIAGALLAVSVGHLLTPLAEGSGLPQLKSILAGTSLPQYLTPSVGAAKLVGLVLALGAGLSVGREGPFCHISACLAALLWRLPYFRSVAVNDALRRQMLAAAVAAGVTGIFGTPVGAVLFGVEVSATYYLVSGYFSAFLCAIVCRFAFDLVSLLRDEELSGTGAGLAPIQTLTAEVLSFAILGVGCGLLASLFVAVTNKCHIARRLLVTRPRRRYLIAAVVAAVVGTTTYLTPFLRQPDRVTLRDLFSAGNQMADSAAWTGGAAFPLILSLLLYVVVKFVNTVLCISLPIPAGLFVPCFIVGAASGRLYGELLKSMLPAAAADDIQPGVYAMVGAAAMVSGVTQTVSTAVIVFELTGSMGQLLPVLVGTLIAYSTSSIFTLSIYDVFIKLAGLPYLPRVYSAALYDLTAGQIAHALLPATAAAHPSGGDHPAAAVPATTALPVLAVYPPPRVAAVKTLLLAIDEATERAAQEKSGSSGGGSGGRQAAAVVDGSEAEADEEQDEQEEARADMLAVLPHLREIAVVDNLHSMRLLGSVQVWSLRQLFAEPVVVPAQEEPQQQQQPTEPVPHTPLRPILQVQTNVMAAATPVVPQLQGPVLITPVSPIRVATSAGSSSSSSGGGGPGGGDYYALHDALGSAASPVQPQASNAAAGYTGAAAPAVAVPVPLAVAAASGARPLVDDDDEDDYEEESTRLYTTHRSGTPGHSQLSGARQLLEAGARSVASGLLQGGRLLLRTAVAAARAGARARRGSAYSELWYDQDWLQRPLHFEGLGLPPPSLGAAEGATGADSGAGAAAAAAAAPAPSLLAPVPVATDPAPFALPAGTPLTRVHFLFAIGVLRQVWVTSSTTTLVNSGSSGGSGGSGGGAGSGIGIEGGGLAGVLVADDLCNTQRLYKARDKAGGV